MPCWHTLCGIGSRNLASATDITIALVVLGEYWHQTKSFLTHSATCHIDAFYDGKAMGHLSRTVACTFCGVADRRSS